MLLGLFSNFGICILLLHGRVLEFVADLLDYLKFFVITPEEDMVVDLGSLRSELRVQSKHHCDHILELLPSLFDQVLCYSFEVELIVEDVPLSLGPVAEWVLPFAHEVVEDAPQAEDVDFESLACLLELVLVLILNDFSWLPADATLDGLCVVGALLCIQLFREAHVSKLDLI